MSAVSFERFEYKYILPSVLAESIRGFIRPYVSPDSHAEGSYRVSNIYLDTPDLFFYRQHRRGSIYRFKLRIRAYNVHSADSAFLEIKRKVKNVTLKNRVRIPREKAADFIRDGRDQFFSGLQAEHLTFFRGQSILHGAVPVLLIDYDREAYESVMEDESRITFDRNIRCRPSQDFEFPVEDGGWIHLDREEAMGGVPCGILMELKFTSTCPGWMVDLIRTFNLERRSFSKYMAGMNFGLRRWINDPSWDRATLLKVDHE